jgi:hypothetical protein
MIDARSFMKFFSEEFGIKFVDVATGKDAIEVIDEQRRKKENSYNNPNAQV